MKRFICLFIVLISLVSSNIMAKDIMILKLAYGDVEIELYPDKAPNHVKRFKELSNSGKYDGVVFHRVIEGFMAQTGDVKQEYCIKYHLIFSAAFLQAFLACEY